MTEVLLVRHCESTGQQPEAPLAAAGLASAAELAAVLSAYDVDHLLSSPFRRALQTIEPFALQSGLPVNEDRRLVERLLSSEPRDDWQEQLRRTWSDFDYRAPGGETSREAQSRGCEVVDEIFATGHRRAVLVSHGNLIGLVLHSIDPCFDYDAWSRLTNPDVFRLARAAGRYTAERLWQES